MNPISPRRAGNARLETLSSYCGSSKPVKLAPTDRQIGEAVDDQLDAEERGRKPDLYTRTAKGKSHRPPLNPKGRRLRPPGDADGLCTKSNSISPR